MRRLIFLRSASRDLADTLEYITRESGDLAIGRDFVSKLSGQCEKLASLPGTLGRLRPELGPDIRSFPFRGYVILFRYTANAFEVIDIVEGHRDIGRAFRRDEER